MSADPADAVAQQRDYYAQTAAAYDDMHLCEADEHAVAFAWLAALIRMHDFTSLLDVGTGTGRCLRALKQQDVPIRAVGVEPVTELREIGRRNGLTEAEILPGDVLDLAFESGSFDVVCAFAVLHHVKDHRRAVAEMCRVARRAVFISDSNNFGQGSALARAVKQGLHACRLWPAYDLLRTRGRGYQSSEGDGIFYSYSIFNDVPVLRRRFSDLRFMSTVPSGANLYRSAPHVAVFACGESGSST